MAELFELGSSLLSGLRPSVRSFQVTVEQTGQTTLNNIQCTRAQLSDDADGDLALITKGDVMLIFKYSDLGFEPVEGDFKVTYPGPGNEIFRAFGENGRPPWEWQGATRESIIVYCKQVPD